MELSGDILHRPQRVLLRAVQKAKSVKVGCGASRGLIESIMQPNLTHSPSLHRPTLGEAIGASTVVAAARAGTGLGTEL